MCFGTRKKCQMRVGWRRRCVSCVLLTHGIIAPSLHFVTMSWGVKNLDRNSSVQNKGAWAVRLPQTRTPSSQPTLIQRGLTKWLSVLFFPLEGGLSHSKFAVSSEPRNFGENDLVVLLSTGGSGKTPMSQLALEPA